MSLVRAGTPLRPRPRFRRLRRRAAGRAVRADGARRRLTAALAELSRAAIAAAIHVGALQRSARALRAAGAVPRAATPRHRTWARSRRWTSSSDASSQPSRERQERGAPRRDHRRGGPRRRARRSRRAAARQPALPVDHARAAGARGAGRRPPASSDDPVSTRRVSHTFSTGPGSARQTACAARIDRGRARRRHEAVPRVRLAAAGDGRVDGTRKAILAGKVEAYDLAARSAARRTIWARVQPPGRHAARLEDYPVPSPDAAQRRPTRWTRRRASGSRASGYVERRRRPDCPERRAAAGGHDGALRAMLRDGVRTLRGGRLRAGDSAAGEDPGRRSVQPRCDAAAGDGATRRSDRDGEAIAAFRKAGELAPRSTDVRLYLALHYARGRDWPRAVPLLEQVVARGARTAAGARGAGGDARAAGADRRTPSSCASGSIACARRLLRS